MDHILKLKSCIDPQTKQFQSSVQELQTKIQTLAEEYKVQIDKGDFQILAMDIYTKYLVAMCKNPFCKTTELKELENLRTVLKLQSLDIGEAHWNAATEFYRSTCLFTPEEELQDDGHPDRMSLDKLLWLSSRSIKSADSVSSSSEDNKNAVEEEEGAYVFEMSRIAKVMNVNFPDEVNERLQHIAELFYERALKSTRAKLEMGVVSA